jgi:adenylyl- and sulfurtransferase ThiI
MSDTKAPAITVTITIEHALKTNAELVFAYQMRDQVAVRGQLAVQKEFPAWFQNYLTDKLEQEAKQITARIEQKKWNMVVELQKKFKYTLEEATKQVFGVPLVQQPATNVTKVA